ncbi:hypothetical protein J3R82DRAFT_7511 [Butyriboletus roseoflavus]|nr:hypothetical protein J3R82DRAFT_7511 [Butyriboletus roseoflavus]
MNTSPLSKRIKLDPSPSPSPSSSPNDENPKESDSDDLNQEHCTICLQSFLDRTIVPVCAHEFCFECIFLWSEQSRKCPLCARSFDNSYLIHHIRSQYDYQKHYLPPSRSSPLPPLTGESRVNALRNTRRERQWGRRQRQQREEADQLERAISRRRWIYHHRLYAKHIASNPYTRYRPFPPPAQFAASPDFISRMTTFLRRELRVWPNLDVEFLTTYTISLMKSIDIRSESAVKLLSEFLDLDTPYTAGERHVNAEHFAHEIYSYLRSPYRDLNTYDQMAQYDTPPEISPSQELERGRRWSAERSPSRRSRSKSNSRYRPPLLRRENGVIHSPAPRHGRDNSAEGRCEDRPTRRHSRNRSPRSIPPDREDRDPRNHPSGRRHSPPNGRQDFLRNVHSQPGGMSYSEASSSAILAENEDNKEKSQVTEILPTTDAPEMSAPQGGDSAAVLAVDHIDEGTGNDYVDKVRDGSSANPQPSRKRSAGLSVHVHPRNRTLSESVQAYLSRPFVPRYPTKKHSVAGDEQPTRVSNTGTAVTGRSATDTRPSLLLRLTDGLADPDTGKLPRKTTVGRTANGDPSTPNDTASQQHPGCRSRSYVFLPGRCSSTVAEHADAAIQHGDCVDDGATRSRRFLPSTDHKASRDFSVANPSPELPPVPCVTLSTTRNGHDVALPHAFALKGSFVDERSGSRHGESLSQGRCIHMETGAERGTGDRARPGDVQPANDDALDLPGRWSLMGGAATSASLDDHKYGHGYGGTNKDTWPGVEVSTGANAAGPLFLHGGERPACEAGELAVGGGLGDVMSRDAPAFGPGSRSGSVSTTDADALELETRLRARARLRVRLAAIRGTGSAGPVGPVSVSSSGVRVRDKDRIKENKDANKV